MKKIIQTASGFQEVDSDQQPQYFSPEELIIAKQEKEREQDIDAMIAKAKSLGWI